MPRWSRSIDPAIEEAIREGIRAGVFRAAARTNPKSSTTWSELADHHTRRATALLSKAIGSACVATGLATSVEKTSDANWFASAIPGSHGDQ